MRVPCSREKNVRLGMRHGEIGDADFRPLVEHPLPMLAPVCRFVDAALVARPVGMAQDTYVHRVGIVRINQDATDLLRVGEANVFPGRPAIFAAIDTIARCKVRADIRLARAGIHYVRI